jgi:hypothetical protein
VPKQEKPCASFALDWSVVQRLFGKPRGSCHSPDDESFTDIVAKREPGPMTLSVLATILERPLAGAVTWCKASSTRTSTIGFPAVTIVPSATYHLKTVPSDKMQDAQSASSTLISRIEISCLAASTGVRATRVCWIHEVGTDSPVHPLRRSGLCVLESYQTQASRESCCSNG